MPGLFDEMLKAFESSRKISLCLGEGDEGGGGGGGRGGGGNDSAQ